VGAAGDVAGREDVGIARPQRLVDQDSMVDRETGALASSVRGAAPIPSSTASASTVRPCSSRIVAPRADAAICSIRRPRMISTPAAA
jgi:hypothetical protein